MLDLSFLYVGSNSRSLNISVVENRHGICRIKLLNWCLIDNALLDWDCLVSDRLVGNGALGDQLNLGADELLSNRHLLHKHLLCFLNWLVDNLLLDGLVFNSLLESLLRDVLNKLVLIDLGNILSLVFDGIVISDFLLSGNIFDSLDSFVFDDCLLIRNVLNARFSFNDFPVGSHCSCGDMNCRLIQHLLSISN